MTRWGMWFTGFVQEIEISSYEQVVYAKIRICPYEWNA